MRPKPPIPMKMHFSHFFRIRKILKFFNFKKSVRTTNFLGRAHAIDHCNISEMWWVALRMSLTCQRLLIPGLCAAWLILREGRVRVGTGPRQQPLGVRLHLSCQCWEAAIVSWLFFLNFGLGQSFEVSCKWNRPSMV